MFGINSQNGYTEVTKGIRIKALCHGEATSMVEFLLDKGALLPEHNHVHEQTGYLVRGKIRLYIDGTSRDILPGDSWSIKKDIKHKAEIIEDSVAIEIFSPVREDYLKYTNTKDMIL